MNDVPIRWPEVGTKVRLEFAKSKKRGIRTVVEGTVVDALHRFCVIDTGKYRVTISDQNVRLGEVRIRRVRAS